ncbi:MAG: succinate dehydrogenase, cytochrome b556 subunit [Arenicellales bacterium]|jgi:succinate dehydrogenase / fumarate reductase cytochrome b subunit
MANTNRPLSPHLQVYRPQLTSVLSIAHRATGVVLTAGVPFFLYWVWSLTTGAEHYARAQSLFGSVPGRVLLLGFSYSLFYHLCNGIRHLVWDTGRSLELDAVYRGGRIVVAASVVLTLVTWLVAYAVRGGAM